MRTRRFEWEGADATAKAIRRWGAASEPPDIGRAVAEIREAVRTERDIALRRLTERFDAVERMPASLRVDPGEARAAIRS